MPNPFSTVLPWNAVAEGYAAEAAFVTKPFSEFALSLVAPGSDAHLLDVACGPGILTLMAAQRVASVKALDFSAAMIAQLQAQLDAGGVGNVDAVVGDGQSLPFADNSFDGAFSMFGLMFFPDRMRGFGELHRALKPGRPAVVSSWAPVEMSPMMQLMFGAIAATNPGQAAPERDHFSLQNPKVFEAEMIAAGFVEVSIEPHAIEIELPEVEVFWERMIRASAPLVMMRKAVGEEAWAEKEGLALEWLRDNPPEGTTSTTAYIGFGRKPA